MFKKFLAACAGIVLSGSIALADAGDAIVKMDRVEMVKSQIFAVPVPPGWSHVESINETYVMSADLSTGIGFLGLEKIRPMAPVQFLRLMTNAYGVRDFKIVTSKRTPVQIGEQIEVTYTSTAPDGTRIKTWAQVATCDFQAPGMAVGAGYMWSASTYADRFDAMSDGLRSLALQIQIVNNEAAFNRGLDMIVLQDRNLNHPMDHSFTSSYWSRQLSQEAAAKRDSEVRRGSFMMLDPHDGSKYFVGPTAFRPDGTVPNPARPNENLVPPKYWVGHSINP